MLRAVIDTNVWISALLNPFGPPAQVLDALLQNRFSSIVSNPLLQEIEDVLARPRFEKRYGIVDEDRREFVRLIQDASILVPVSGSITVCRDPDDDLVIETALRGRAHALVTRDDDLKGASEVITYLQELDVQVLTVNRFLLAIEQAN